MQGGLYDLALSIPWCITDAALEAMLSIAARDPLPREVVAASMHGKPEALATRNDPLRPDSDRLAIRDGVALLTIDGPIYRYADLFTSLSGGVTTEALARDFQLALDDPEVAAILFMIDSPGGEATGINELSNMIYGARGKKPIVSYIEGFGASAAYWIASAADRVVIDATALVGSIGTIMGVPDPEKRMSRTIDFVSSQSPNKRPDPHSDSGRAYLQKLVDDMTVVFIESVARNRAIDLSSVSSVGGGLLVGEQAVAAGLADSLGSEEQLIAELAAPVSRYYGAWRRAYGGGSTMASQGNRSSFFADLFKGMKESGIAGDDGAPVASADIISLEALAAPEDPRVAALQAELARMRSAQIDLAAKAFADDMVRSGMVKPADHGALLQLYARAAEDDQLSPIAGGSRVELLSSFVKMREPLKLTGELVPQPLLTALPGASSTSDQDLRANGRAQGEEYARRVNRRR